MDARREALFWARVDKSAGPEECWPISGTKDRWGYAKFCGRGAHRVAFRLANGYEARLSVLHRCDNPACCQPRHLYDGSHLQNMRDMVQRNRVATGERNGRYLHGKYVGERIPGTRLLASAHPELVGRTTAPVLEDTAPPAPTPAEVSTPCVHWWVCESANGPTSLGTCRKCQATKMFSNSEPAGLNDTLSEKRLRAGAAMRKRSQAQKAAFLGDVAENSEGQWL